MKANNILRLLVVAALGLSMMSCEGVAKRVNASVAEGQKILAGDSQRGQAAGASAYDAGGVDEAESAGGLQAGLEIPAPQKSSGEIILKRMGYTASYNSSMRVPYWVAWHLTAAHLKGNTKRSESKFHEDDDVPEPRAVDFDYVRSGYDRGHMCPAGDNKWSQQAMDQSFLFTNVCPQAPSLNRGDWNEMEQACRKWARQYGDLYIVCGPIFYKKRPKTIGKNKVAVPDAFFKVVLSMKGEPKAIGFIYKNADGNRPKGDYANSVDEVERITGLDFFPSLPDDVEKRVEAQCCPDDWDL